MAETPPPTTDAEEVKHWYVLEGDHGATLAQLPDNQADAIRTQRNMPIRRASDQEVEQFLEAKEQHRRRKAGKAGCSRCGNVMKGFMSGWTFERWLGVRWMGYPWPKRLWAWAFHPEHPRPGTFAGCGCLWFLKKRREARRTTRQLMKRWEHEIAEYAANYVPAPRNVDGSPTQPQRPVWPERQPKDG